jgi:ParB family chromosome partitioning protein
MDRQKACCGGLGATGAQPRRICARAQLEPTIPRTEERKDYEQMREREIKSLSIEHIVVSHGREVDNEAVAKIAESIELIGLQNPITVFEDDNRVLRVISGRHRLAAARSLGMDRIDALIYRGLSDIELRLAEITENLHRAELTPLQRSEQITEYAKLAKERREQGPAQVGQHISNVKGASGREGGDSAAARDLGLTRQGLQRAGKIANIAPEAKAAAKKAGLDGNQSALLKVAAAPKEQQEKVVNELAHEKERKKRPASRSNVAGEQRLDNDADGQKYVKDENATRSGDDIDQPRVGRNVQETVSAILRDFDASDVRLIIDALSKEIVKKGAANSPVVPAPPVAAQPKKASAGVELEELAI